MDGLLWEVPANGLVMVKMRECKLRTDHPIFHSIGTTYSATGGNFPLGELLYFKIQRNGTSKPALASAAIRTGLLSNSGGMMGKVFFLR
jgi:hypothetical protein